MARRRSQTGLVLAGAVVVLGGVAVAVTELLHFPKGSVWVVVAVTMLAVWGIRAATSRRD